jgi:hypothetical protein
MVGYSGDRRSERGRGQPPVGRSHTAAVQAAAAASAANATGRERAESAGKLAKFGRWVISGWLLVHLLSVVAEPLRMFSRSEYRPAAPHIWLLRSSLAPYIEFLYLSHGYFFFAPNPGPNHILEFRFRPPTAGSSDESLSTRLADSQTGELGGDPDLAGFDTLRFPERGKQWPRLLYHRYFMLSEFYQQLYRQAPIELEEEALRVPQLWDQWQEARQLYLDVQASLRRRAMAMRPDQRVEIRRLMHELPSDVLILQEGWSVNDPRLYITLPESVTELNLPAGAVEPGTRQGEELPRPADRFPVMPQEPNGATPGSPGGQRSPEVNLRGDQP